jgi:hypothetical protein
MRRKFATLLMFVLVAATVVGIKSASAHQCPNDYQPDDPECQETAVYEDWRNNYITVFDLADRHGEEGEQQRYDAQRWRDRCHRNGEYQQQCAWVDGGQSLVPDPNSDAEPVDILDGILSRPNELHAGFAATHCFLAEAAHDCDRHGSGSEFDTHDSHGGAIYADICLSANANSKFCDDGLKDTQVGVTIVDHLTCPAGCFDEYHVIRPFDSEYTDRQMANSISDTQTAANDPQRHVCGHEDKGSDC